MCTDRGNDIILAIAYSFEWDNVCIFSYSTFVEGNKWIYRIFPIALNIKIERLEMRFRPSGTPEML